MLLQCGMCRHVQTCGHVGRGTSWQTHTHQFPVVLIKRHVSAEIKRYSNNIVIVTATFVHSPELILLLTSNTTFITLYVIVIGTKVVIYLQ